MNISKRDFLRRSALALGGTLALPLAGRTFEAHAQAAASTPFTLPDLPYDFAALEPHIDRQTMQLHHDRHHQTYVNNLNNAVAARPRLRSLSPEQLISNLTAVPASVRETVRNNAGGHVNHTMFWSIMSPQGGGEPTGDIARVIRTTFGSFERFKTRFNEAGEKRFGSGWVWLARDRRGRFSIETTPNQDNPLMQGLYPVMGNDVWEHAYYLKYNNRRGEYLKAWWNTVNWNEVNNRLRAA